ncbi:MAG: hypothetical protein NVSMB26_04580 [Beijerinckiaceae bacterium]
MEQNFDPSDGVAAHANAVKTRGDDARIVDHECIIRPQQLGQIADHPVFEASAARVDDKQSRRIARNDGPQSNALFRQDKIE